MRNLELLVLELLQQSKRVSSGPQHRANQDDKVPNTNELTSASLGSGRGNKEKRAVRRASNNLPVVFDGLLGTDQPEGSQTNTTRKHVREARASVYYPPSKTPNDEPSRPR